MKHSFRIRNTEKGASNNRHGTAADHPQRERTQCCRHRLSLRPVAQHSTGCVNVKRDYRREPLFQGTRVLPLPQDKKNAYPVIAKRLPSTPSMMPKSPAEKRLKPDIVFFDMPEHAEATAWSRPSADGGTSRPMSAHCFVVESPLQFAVCSVTTS